MRARALCLVVLAAIVGCGSDNASDDIAWESIAALPEYAIDATPRVTIGDDGTQNTQFVRIAARHLSTGEIAVAELDAGEIALFDANGKFVRKVATRGSGPGELDGTFTLGTADDTLIAFGQPPMSSRDVRAFTVDGKFNSRIRLSATGQPSFMAVNRMPTGQFLVKAGMAAKILNGPPPIGVLQPDTVRYGLYFNALDSTNALHADSADGRVHWLDPVVRASSLPFEVKGTRLGFSMDDYPYAPQTFVVVSGDLLWIVDGGSGILRAVAATGTEVVNRKIDIKRALLDHVVLNATRLDALKRAVRGFDSVRVNAIHDPKFAPTEMPFFSSAFAGAGGDVWLKLFSSDLNADQHYLIVDKAGASIGRGTLPARFDLQHIGKTFVLGTRLTKDGVPEVVEFSTRSSR